MSTEKQNTKKLLTHLNGLINYWSKTDNNSNDKVAGVVFSVLVTIDGGTDVFPHGIDLIDPQSGERISTGYLHEILGKYNNEK